MKNPLSKTESFYCNIFVYDNDTRIKILDFITDFTLKLNPSQNCKFKIFADIGNYRFTSKDKFCWSDTPVIHFMLAGNGIKHLGFKILDEIKANFFLDNWQTLFISDNTVNPFNINTFNRLNDCSNLIRFKYRKGRQQIKIRNFKTWNPLEQTI